MPALEVCPRTARRTRIANFRWWHACWSPMSTKQWTLWDCLKVLNETKTLRNKIKFYQLIAMGSKCPERVGSSLLRARGCRLYSSDWQLKMRYDNSATVYDQRRRFVHHASARATSAMQAQGCIRVFEIALNKSTLTDFRTSEQI